MAATGGLIYTCTKLWIGLSTCSTCTCFSSNYFVQIFYLFVYPLCLRIFGNLSSNQFVQLKLKLFYFVRIIRNYTVVKQVVCRVCVCVCGHLLVSVYVVDSGANGSVFMFA